MTTMTAPAFRIRTPAVVAGLVLALAPLAASSATFDLAAAAADAKAERGAESYFSEVMPDGWTVDGITLTTSSDAWLDGPWRRGVSAGLGVCNAPDGDCNGSPFDGINAGEQLTLKFSEPVRATWTIRETGPLYASGGPDHTLREDDVILNGVRRSVAGGVLVGDGYLTEWTFGVPDDEPFNRGIYLAAAEIAPIPLPAAGLGLLAGLTGLGALRMGRVAR